MSWKRPLFLLHRWAGIVLCLFFALWFVSGIFMMYVEFPQLTNVERLAGSSRLDFSTATLAPGAAASRLQPGDFATKATPSELAAVEPEHSADAIVTPRSIRVAMIGARPAYIVHPDNGAQPRVVFADDGEVLREVTPAAGQMAVAAFIAKSGRPMRLDAASFAGRLQTDQWTVSSALNDHRPLLKYVLHDGKGSVLYVSSTTGEVVRDTHTLERVLNYFGAVTHWLYPTFIRKYPAVWEWMVDILSGVGVVLAITGLWIGILRWNRRARPNKPQVPYKGLMRWHYFSGIIFGVVTVTWVFSGLLSMNPLNLNPSRRASNEEQLVYTGKPLTAGDFELPAAGFGPLAIDAELVHYLGHSFYRVTDRDATVHMVGGNARSSALPEIGSMLTLAPKLIPGAPLADATVLTAYDNYYYTRHPERGDRMLPVIRVRFEDSQHTWFHLDPLSGQIIDRSTRTNRVYRWLYNGLHSFDLWWLWQRRPLWDICVITFSLGGVLLSMIGVVIGWRRLRYKQERRATASIGVRVNVTA